MQTVDTILSVHRCCLFSLKNASWRPTPLLPGLPLPFFWLRGVRVMDGHRAASRLVWAHETSGYLHAWLAAGWGPGVHPSATGSQSHPGVAPAELPPAREGASLARGWPPAPLLASPTPPLRCRLWAQQRIQGIDLLSFLNLAIPILENHLKEIIKCAKKCMNKHAIYNLKWNVM